MTTINSVRYQYRSFEHVYLFKVKEDESLTLKIFDLTQKCLWKKAFSSKDLGIADTKRILAGGNFTKIFNKLNSCPLLPKEYASPTMPKTTKEEVEKSLSDAIDRYKPNVLGDEEQIEDYICVITQEVFKDPVIDNHGHTFEKTAIEEHMKLKGDICPLSMEPITSLAPNRLARDMVEKWHKQDPIPTFAKFKKENAKLADTNISMAQTYTEEEEYTEALDCYTKAFRYTNNWNHYLELPALFEKMGENEKATLSYLYLAKYQLEAGKVDLAITTLENCQKGKTSYLRVSLVLTKLYQFSNNPKKALELSIFFAESSSKENPTEAIRMYKQILSQYPDQLALYLPLSELLKTPEEKVQVLLKGSLEAIYQKDYKQAKLLCEKADTRSSFVDHLVYLNLLKKQKNIPLLKKQLHKAAKVFEEQGQIGEMLKVYKMLYSIEKHPEYCEKIVEGYGALEKKQKEFEWSMTYLSLLIKNKSWEQAEQIAEQTLEKTNNPEKHLPLYEKLEEVYSHWKGHKLENLLEKLGKSYEENKQLELAEKTYQKAYERFHGFSQAISYADLLSVTGKKKQSVSIYYEGSVEALVEQDTKKLSLCLEKIKKIDPKMDQLEPRKKMDLLTQTQILKLSQGLEEANLKLSQGLEKANQEIAVLKNAEEKRLKAKRLKAKRLEEKRVEEKRVLEQKQKEEFLSRVAFGKKAWETYFGDIGVEPALPKDIDKILQGPCPIWPGKRVQDTHLLVLIPKTVKGSPLTLDSLSELIQKPQGGGHSTKYRRYDSDVKKEHGNKGIRGSHWALMTRDVVPNSRDKSYEAQKELVASFAKKSRKPYRLPKVLEAAASMLMHYVKTGERLYTDEPLTYTRCEEKVCGGEYPVGIGGFAAGGLSVYNYVSGAYQDVGVGALWELPQ